MYFSAWLAAFFVLPKVSFVFACLIFVYAWLQTGDSSSGEKILHGEKPLQAGGKGMNRSSYFKWLPLLIFCFAALRSFPGFVFLLAGAVPLGFVFDPLRFALFCILFLVYFVFVKRGCFKKRRWTLLRCGAALWGIGFLSAFHMYFFGDFSQCPKDINIRSRGVTPVLTSKICSRNKIYLGEWDECHEDLGTTHAVYADAKTGRLFIPHMGSKKQVPVCVFRPSSPLAHASLKFRGSVHHLVVDEKRRRLFLPLMSDNKILVANMDTLKMLDVLKPTVNSSLIDILVDDTRDAIYVLSENSEIVRVSLKTKKTKRVSLKRHARGALYALAMNKKTRRIYVSSWLGGSVIKIHADTLKVEKVKRQSLSVMGLQVDEKHNVVYAALPFSSAIVALNGNSLEEQWRYPAGLGVRDIAYLENMHMLMAGNYLRRTVDFVDLGTGKKVRSFYVGPMVRGVYYDAKHFHAYSIGRCGIYRFNVKTFSLKN